MDCRGQNGSPVGLKFLPVPPLGKATISQKT